MNVCSRVRHAYVYHVYYSYIYTYIYIYIYMYVYAPNTRSTFKRRGKHTHSTCILYIYICIHTCMYAAHGRERWTCIHCTCILISTYTYIHTCALNICRTWRRKKVSTGWPQISGESESESESECYIQLSLSLSLSLIVRCLYLVLWRKMFLFFCERGEAVFVREGRQCL